VDPRPAPADQTFDADLLLACPELVG
jgi:hypothetical protein